MDKQLGVIPLKKINKEVKKIEEVKIPKTPKNPKNMALPKGVKSQVDYTKLYMSNELDGEVLLEKEPELPKFTKVKNKSFQKPKVKKFKDYTGVKSTFKDFIKKVASVDL